jgi:hypothetical protein
LRHEEERGTAAARAETERDGRVLFQLATGEENAEGDEGEGETSRSHNAPVLMLSRTKLNMRRKPRATEIVSAIRRRLHR